MIVCFKCPPNTKDELDKLVSRGTYRDHSEAIVSAIQNLLLVHEEVEAQGAVVIGAAMPAESIAGVEGFSDDRALGHVAVDQRAERIATGVPELFSRVSLSSSPPTVLPVPPSEYANARDVPIDRWIFGQFSKLLPAKASCRALSHIAKDHEAGFELNKVAGRIAVDASLLADYLSELDEKNGATRDDSLALGFPTNGHNADRSRMRYASQFVGTMTKQGELWGLLSALRMVDVVGGRRVQLTDAGWRFAQLRNPVLDDRQAGPRFAADEVQFLIAHICAHVPEEDFAFRTILTAVRDNANTPQALDRTFHELVPRKRRAELSDAFLSTQRTGVVSRLKELGLLDRVRDGVRVSYVVTDAGAEYLAGTRVSI